MFWSIRPIIELIRDLMAIYTLSKLGADWLIFVDVRNKKIRTDIEQTDDGRTADGRCVIRIAQ